MNKKLLNITSLFFIIISILLLNGCRSFEFESALLYITQYTEWDKAIKYMEKSIAKKPNDIEAYILYGQAYGMKEE